MTVGLMKAMLDCAILRKCRTFRLYTIKWWIGKKVKFGENRQVNNGNSIARVFILSLVLFVSGIACRTTQSNEPVLEPTLQPTPASEFNSVAVDYWRPSPEETLQLQFEGSPIDISIQASVFDVDLFEVDVSDIDALHERGVHVLCYINVGAWEDWRSDAFSFPASVIGNDYDGWPGEKWLDIRRIDLLGPILIARLDLCKEKGFDGVEPDNLDGFTNSTGFDLTAEHQIKFNLWIAQEAHKRGLAVGLKNDPEQVPVLIDSFDFAIFEDCFAQNWCNSGLPFIVDRKPVFVIEYTDSDIDMEAFCSYTKTFGLAGLLKKRSLDVFREDCSAY